MTSEVEQSGGHGRAGAAATAAVKRRWSPAMEDGVVDGSGEEEAAAGDDKGGRFATRILVKPYVP